MSNPTTKPTTHREPRIDLLIRGDGSQFLTSPARPGYQFAIVSNKEISDMAKSIEQFRKVLGNLNPRDPKTEAPKEEEKRQPHCTSINPWCDFPDCPCGWP